MQNLMEIMAWLQTGLLPLQSTAAPENRKCRSDLLNTGIGMHTQIFLGSQRPDKAEKAVGTCVQRKKPGRKATVRGLLPPPR